MVGKETKSKMDIEKITKRLDDFTKKRDWDKFHSPKNLSMALSVEVSELVEIFQWLTEKESIDIINNEKEMAMVKEEVADIMIYLLRLVDKLQIDLEKVVLDKISKNEEKYPELSSKGNATKYNRR
ncbi:MAG: nucleotide pyrophosphohydrolase [Thermodesulfovibrionales bacterium]|nr:nucleotide pyrophosphohydrolase [Thermodesulfovibrionales bacterium]